MIMLRVLVWYHLYRHKHVLNSLQNFILRQFIRGYSGRVLWSSVLEPIVYPLLQRLYSVPDEAGNHSDSTKALVLHGSDLLEERMNTFKYHRTHHLFILAIVGYWCGVAMHL